MSQGATPVHPYIPNSAPQTKAEMLRAVGAGSIDEFFAVIPERLRMARPLDLPPALAAESELERHFTRLLGRNVQLDRDFVLNVTLAEAFMPSALVAADGPEHCAVMLNLYRAPDRLGREPRDFVFLLDRSGSMGGESIAQALDALRLALRSMEAGDTFNVVGFGSRQDAG